MARSKLQSRVGQLLREKYPQLEILENTRPDWLLGYQGQRLELDFYMPSIDVAIEVQGSQHYRFTPQFHASFEDFKEQCKRDEAKREQCDAYGITLIEVDTEGVMVDVFETISSRHVAVTKAPPKRQKNLDELNENDQKYRVKLLTVSDQLMKLNRSEIRRLKSDDPVGHWLKVFWKYIRKYGGLQLLELLTDDERYKLLHLLRWAEGRKADRKWNARERNARKAYLQDKGFES